MYESRSTKTIAEIENNKFETLRNGNFAVIGFADVETVFNKKLSDVWRILVAELDSNNNVVDFRLMTFSAFSPIEFTENGTNKRVGHKGDLVDLVIRKRREHSNLKPDDCWFFQVLPKIGLSAGHDAVVFNVTTTAVPTTSYRGNAYVAQAYTYAMVTKTDGSPEQISLGPIKAEIETFAKNRGIAVYLHDNTAINEADSAEKRRERRQNAQASATPTNPLA